MSTLRSVKGTPFMAIGRLESDNKSKKRTKAKAIFPLASTLRRQTPTSPLRSDVNMNMNRNKYRGSASEAQYLAAIERRSREALINRRKAAVGSRFVSVSSKKVKDPQPPARTTVDTEKYPDDISVSDITGTPLFDEKVVIGGIEIDSLNMNQTALWQNPSPSASPRGNYTENSRVSKSAHTLTSPNASSRTPRTRNSEYGRGQSIRQLGPIRTFDEEEDDDLFFMTVNELENGDGGGDGEIDGDGDDDQSTGKEQDQERAESSASSSSLSSLSPLTIRMNEYKNPETAKTIVSQAVSRINDGVSMALRLAGVRTLLELFFVVPGVILRNDIIPAIPTVKKIALVDTVPAIRLEAAKLFLTALVSFVHGESGGVYGGESSSIGVVDVSRRDLHRILTVVCDGLKSKNVNPNLNPNEKANEYLNSNVSRRLLLQFLLDRVAVAAAVPASSNNGGGDGKGNVCTFTVESKGEGEGEARGRASNIDIDSGFAGSSRHRRRHRPPHTITIGQEKNGEGEDESEEIQAEIQADIVWVQYMARPREERQEKAKHPVGFTSDIWDDIVLDGQLIPTLMGNLNDNDSNIVWLSAQLLNKSKVKSSRVLSTIVSRFSDRRFQVRIDALNCIRCARFSSEEEKATTADSIAALCKVEGKVEVRETIYPILEEMVDGGGGIGKYAIEWAKSRSETLRQKALIILQEAHDMSPAALQTVVNSLSDSSPTVRGQGVLGVASLLARSPHDVMLENGINLSALSALCLIVAGDESTGTKSRDVAPVRAAAVLAMGTLSWSRNEWADDKVQDNVTMITRVLCVLNEASEDSAEEVAIAARQVMNKFGLTSKYDEMEERKKEMQSELEAKEKEREKGKDKDKDDADADASSVSGNSETETEVESEVTTHIHAQSRSRYSSGSLRGEDQNALIDVVRRGNVTQRASAVSLLGAWANGQGSELVEKILLERLRRDPHEYVRAQSARSLSLLHPVFCSSNTVEHLVRCVQSSEGAWSVRAEALKTLVVLSGHSALLTQNTKSVTDIDMDMDVNIDIDDRRRNTETNAVKILEAGSKIDGDLWTEAIRAVLVGLADSDFKVTSEAAYGIQYIGYLYSISGALGPESVDTDGDGDGLNGKDSAYGNGNENIHSTSSVSSFDIVSTSTYDTRNWEKDRTLFRDLLAPMLHDSHPISRIEGLRALRCGEIMRFGAVLNAIGNNDSELAKTMGIYFGDSVKKRKGGRRGGSGEIDTANVTKQCEIVSDEADFRVVQYAASLLEDESPLVRMEAARLINDVRGTARDRVVASALAKRLSKEDNPQVRVGIAEALGRTFVYVAPDSESATTVSSSEAKGESVSEKPRSSLPMPVPVTDSNSSSNANTNTKSVLIGLSLNESKLVRQREQNGENDTVKDNDHDSKGEEILNPRSFNFLHGTGHYAHSEVIDSLKEALQDHDSDVRYAAARSLTLLGIYHTKAIASILDRIEDTKRWMERSESCLLLRQASELGRVSGLSDVKQASDASQYRQIRALSDCLHDENDTVRLIAAKTLLERNAREEVIKTLLNQLQLKNLNHAVTAMKEESEKLGQTQAAVCRTIASLRTKDLVLVKALEDLLCFRVHVLVFGHSGSRAHSHAQSDTDLTSGISATSASAMQNAKKRAMLLDMKTLRSTDSVLKSLLIALDSIQAKWMVASSLARQLGVEHIRAHSLGDEHAVSRVNVIVAITVIVSSYMDECEQHEVVEDVKGDGDDGEGDELRGISALTATDGPLETMLIGMALDQNTHWMVRAAAVRSMAVIFDSSIPHSRVHDALDTLCSPNIMSGLDRGTERVKKEEEEEKVRNGDGDSGDGDGDGKNKAFTYRDYSTPKRSRAHFASGRDPVSDAEVSIEARTKSKTKSKVNAHVSMGAEAAAAATSAKQQRGYQVANATALLGVEALFSLAALVPPAGTRRIRVLTRMLHAENSLVRSAAMRSLVVYPVFNSNDADAFGDRWQHEVSHLIVDTITDSNIEVKKASVECILACGIWTPLSVGLLLIRAGDSHPAIKTSALLGLAAVTPSRVHPYIESGCTLHLQNQKLHNPHPQEQLSILEAGIRDIVLKCCNDKDVNVRAAAICAQVTWCPNSSQALMAVLDRLSDESHIVRVVACRALGTAFAQSHESRSRGLILMGNGDSDDFGAQNSSSESVLSTLSTYNNYVNMSNIGFDPIDSVWDSWMNVLSQISGNIKSSTGISSMNVNNMKDAGLAREEVVAALLRRTSDWNSQVFQASVLALNDIGVPSARLVRHLVDRLWESGDHASRLASMRLISSLKLNVEEAVVAVCRCLNGDEISEVRTAAAGALASLQVRSLQVIESIAQSVRSDPNMAVRRACSNTALALGLRHREVIDGLADLARYCDPHTRSVVERALDVLAPLVLARIRIEAVMRKYDNGHWW